MVELSPLSVVFFSERSEFDEVKWRSITFGSLATLALKLQRKHKLGLPNGSF